MTVAELRSRGELLQTALEREQAERTQLAAELAEARKPVLVRMIEALRRR